MLCEFYLNLNNAVKKNKTERSTHLPSKKVRRLESMGISWDTEIKGEQALSQAVNKGTES